ncbi:hypothetical protein JDV02_001582 [Purpureocillium takamizusanense]|uniref:YTH domain-containing protein n=1 Tax=Purpureocillium takamizusanense TaxID=2060973 RepID=A0A9Q8Q9V7_9HYPO|nr:uncharacterized protein JDV02_001582 [Purpureocillium takamizusanense]UNI15007.1 hypothetical protein JDV02_001582 [Purpureocillium takamizusanense]
MVESTSLAPMAESGDTSVAGNLIVSRASQPGGQGKEAMSGQPPVAYSQQPPTNARHAFSSQLEIGPSPPPYSPSASYDMTQMVNALPGGFRTGQYPQGQPRYHTTNAHPILQQPSQVPGYGGPHVMPMGNQGYYIHQPQVHPYYGGPHMSPTQAQPSMAGRQAMSYYSGQMMMNPPQSAYYYPQGGQYPTQAPAVGGNLTHNAYVSGQALDADSRTNHVHDTRAVTPHIARQDDTGRQGSVRGPPRKPRQSGHAIWVGNLPPQTDLMSLVQHVCKETSGLESLFLISKSNCAFANFKDDKTCVAAQQKLHDSKFQTVRLVSRLRKNTVEGATGLTAPTGPSANNTTSVSTQPQVDPAQDDTQFESDIPGSVVRQHDKGAQSVAETGLQQDRFFILKSLTMEDLDLSVSTGIWATQSHNEEALNSAFKGADNVYLIFSANKSGEYFGYARMISEINDDPAAAIEFAPKTQAADELDLPKAIPTEATEHAPKGKIIDDSARGTIFWEAERDETDGVSDNESEDSSEKSAVVDGEAKTWGKPFKLEWLSTHRLPFYRTRGLRNPWNSNREVKIARDGTELEPSVGRRLIGLFNRVQSPVSMAPPLGMPIAMVQGYPAMRPYGP